MKIFGGIEDIQTIGGKNQLKKKRFLPLLRRFAIIRRRIGRVRDKTGAEKFY